MICVDFKWNNHFVIFSYWLIDPCTEQFLAFIIQSAMWEPKICITSWEKVDIHAPRNTNFTHDHILYYTKLKYNDFTSRCPVNSPIYLIMIAYNTITSLKHNLIHVCITCMTNGVCSCDVNSWGQKMDWQEQSCGGTCICQWYLLDRITPHKLPC